MNTIAFLYTVIILSIVWVNWDQLKSDHRAFVNWCEKTGSVGVAIYALSCLIVLMSVMPWYWV